MNPADIGSSAGDLVTGSDKKASKEAPKIQE
jgi:hypothetical protein